MRLLICLLFIPFFSFAGLKYQSENLKVMDIETLGRIVDRNLANAQRAVRGSSDQDDESVFGQGANNKSYTKAEGRDLVKSSLELVFARPDQNNATSTTYTKIEGVAVDFGGIDGLLEEIVNDALNSLKQDGKDKSLLRDQNTYVYILNNMMSEIKPLVDGDNPPGKLIKKIRDADISFSNSFKSYRLLNNNSAVVNPSKLAGTIVGKRKKSWWNVF